MPPSGKPQMIDEHTWYYEGRGKLHFIVECYDLGAWHKTIDFKVPLAKLIKSIKRIKGEK